MILTILILFFILSFLYLYRFYTYWDRHGIKGPMLFELSGFLLYYHDYTFEMINKYGKVFGSYGVLEKNLIVNDPELIRQVLLDNYQNCHERRSMYLGPYIKDMLVFLPGDHNWKRLRSLVSPLFSSSKIKSMLSHISEITDRFVENLEPICRKGETIDIRKSIDAFAMDVLSSCVFGIKLDSIDNPDHPVVQNAKQFLALSPNLSRILSVLTPRLAEFLKLEFFDPKTVQYFADLTKQIISERRKYKNGVNSSKRIDLIQLMMDAQLNNNDIGKDAQGKLSIDEMIAQGILFFIAGSGTLSASLSHVIYYLSVHKDCQQRLYKELKDVKELSYETLSQLKYLNAVIDETFRLAPPGLRNPRQCVKEFKLDGITVPVGTVIDVLPYALHRDPDYWTDPLEFKPERFICPVHHPWAYIPFGGGPRMCIGRQFALNEMRICCAKLFRAFEFSLVPGFELDYFKGNLVLTPKSLQIELKLRRNMI